MSTRHKLIEDFPITFGDRITLNEHVDTDGEPVREFLDECYDVSLFDFSALSIRDQIEGLHLDTGADVGVASKEFRRLALRGLIKSRTAAGLSDRVAKLFNAFDVEETQRDSPTTEGVLPLAFWTPTDDPPLPFESPLREMFLARPRGFPVVFERKSQGLAYRFAVELVCPDPIRYTYDEREVEFSAGAGWTRLMTNWAIGQGVTVYPVITFTLTGAGASNLTFTDGTTSLVLDMSTATAGDFTIDMKTGEIAKVGTGPRNHVRTSAVDTFFGVPRGGASWTINNRTNLSIATAVYRPGRS